MSAIVHSKPTLLVSSSMKLIPTTTTSKVVSMFVPATLSNISSYFSPTMNYPGFELEEKKRGTSSTNFQLPYFNHNVTPIGENQITSYNNGFFKNIQNDFNVNSTNESIVSGMKNGHEHTHQEIMDEQRSQEDGSALQNLAVWLISTLKRRKKKMNKHKLRKRRKLLRLKSKK